MGPMKCEHCDIAELSDTALVRWVRGTRKEISDMRVGLSTIFSCRGHRHAELDMPDSNQAGQGQDAESGGDQQIPQGRDQNEFLAVDEIGQRAAEQTEDKNRQALGDAGQAELKRRAGEIVDLIEDLRLAHLLRDGGKEREQEKIIGTGANAARPRAVARCSPRLSV